MKELIGFRKILWKFYLNNFGFPFQIIIEIIIINNNFHCFQNDDHFIELYTFLL